ncbi:DEAD/DEAH box helicase, partial [Bacillus anthracis]
MKTLLRPYQQEAVNAVIEYVKSSIMPCMVEAPTGAGKSVIIAEIARIIYEMTGKRILVTAPSAELVIQNRAKFIAT